MKKRGRDVGPYGAGVDEIWKHRFAPVSSELSFSSGMN